MDLPLRGRPAHMPGPTFFSYTPNGKKLVTAGSNTALRVFEHDSDDEPAIIDVTTENHLAVAAGNDFVVVADEAGAVTKYSLSTLEMEDILVRCTAPVRDLAMSPDCQWVAIASEELEVKVVNVNDMEKVMYLREQTRPVKHVSFDVSGSVLSVSCTDGMIYLYSLSSEQPQPIKRIDGIIKVLEPASDASAKAVWHPDGRAFAVPTEHKGLCPRHAPEEIFADGRLDVQIVARKDWQRHKTFSGAHKQDITALAWSHNGALLVTASLDHLLVLWETRTQRILKTFTDVHHTILDLAWHPVENVLSYTNTNGELFIREDFVPIEHRNLLSATLQLSPLNNDPLSEVSGNSRKGSKKVAEADGLSYKHVDDERYLDDLLGPESDDDLDGFIDDDDGAGYAEQVNSHGKRSAETVDGPRAKRQAVYNSWRPRIHDAFQPGSTPWKGNRRYLCLNLIGFVWTVKQESHHTVTVEFYDREAHRDFHFTDPYLYDKACLDSKGTLFSCPASAQHPAIIYYRPHETWTSRVDWRTQLPSGEEVTSLSLSDSCIVATTSGGYVRIYSLFGLPLKVYRQKSTPAVACCSWRDYVMTVGNGPVGGDGTTRLLYTIENVKKDETYQSEDILALPPGSELRSLMFSDQGDPCIYDSDGVLLVLQHWREPGQARWVPLLDTRTMKRLEGGRKDEAYWPVAVANDRFYCIILKGGEQYPYFPRPLHSDFEFQIPLSNVASGDGDNEAVHQKRLEEKFVRQSIQSSLLRDLINGTNASSAQKNGLALMEREVDKSLLLLIASECQERGEDHSMKAYELATLFKDTGDKMLEAAGKVAQRYEHHVLKEKIRELMDRRAVGLVADDD